MVEVFYLTLALLLLLLFMAAGAVIAKNNRLIEQLPPVLLSGATGAGILLLLTPVWHVPWLTDLALAIAAGTLVMVVGITRRLESGAGDADV